MTPTTQVQDIPSQMSQLNELLERVQALPEGGTRDTVTQIIGTLMDFHGAALAKLLDHLANASTTGSHLIADIASDELVGGMLLLYGLHPLDMPARVRMALEHVRPALAVHHGNVELVDITREGVVHLQLQGSCHGCASSQVTLENTIKQAIYDHAPEVTAIQVAGASAPEQSPAAGFFPLEQLIASGTKSRLARNAV